MADAESPDRKGFFRSLYDFKFASLIGERFLRFVYGLMVVFSTIGAAVFVIAILAQDNQVDDFGDTTDRPKALYVIFTVLFYFAYLIYLRIAFEFLIVFFQIGENVKAIRRGGLSPSELAEVTRQSIPSSPATPPPLAVPSSPATASPPAGASTPAGWYDAPGDSTQYRYWDGQKWTEQYSPKGGSA